ncbi:MAG TPA: hypothetical protein VGG48_15245 [Rhizomicrobium sp.]|jgi:hypothetical protein
MPGPTVQTPNGPFTLARNCDGCTLCCRVLEATTLDKPMGVLCDKCIVGTGCGIHETRPEECRHYHCGWLIDAGLGPEWQPEFAHIIITYDLNGMRLNANADPLYPDAWRKEPYYSLLKHWASIALARNGQVWGHVGHHSYAFLPQGEVDMGVMGDDDYAYFEAVPDGWTVRKVSGAEAETIMKVEGISPPGAPG